MIDRADLEEATDLFCELQQAFLSLVQGTGDGYCQPLPDGLSIALIEEVCGGAALTLKVMKHGLGQQEGT